MRFVLAGAAALVRAEKTKKFPFQPAALERISRESLRAQ